MNEKGFTLIEITAIVLVLAAIFMVSFPSILNMSKKEENNKYDAMVENLCLAGQSYIYENNEKFELSFIVGNEISIDVSMLIQNDLVEKGIINPKTGYEVDNDVLIYTVLSDYSLKCNYLG